LAGACSSTTHGRRDRETAEIGDDCTIYQGVTLGGTSLYRGAKRHPTLGAAWSSARARTALSALHGRRRRQGRRQCVVVKPVPPGATATGIPARIIRGEPERHRTACGRRLLGLRADASADDPLSSHCTADQRGG